MLRPPMGRAVHLRLHYRGIAAPGIRPTTASTSTIPMNSYRKLVVLGASAGGVESLRQVVAGLPRGFAAPVLVAMHMPPCGTTVLPRILSNAGVLRARQAEDGERLEAGRIYVAPPGHDLMIEGPCAAVRPSDRGNRFCPSVDGLFQSAAHYAGVDSIGVVLSGALDDGTPGIRSIQRAGGVTVAQSDAPYDSMPRSAGAAIRIGHTLPAVEIGPLLALLTAGPDGDAPRRTLRPTPDPLVDLPIGLDALRRSGCTIDLGLVTAGRPGTVSFRTPIDGSDDGVATPAFLGLAVDALEQWIARLQLLARTMRGDSGGCSPLLERQIAALEQRSCVVRARLAERARHRAATATRDA